MKLPKTRKKYCPFCKTHTTHRVMEAKRGSRSSLSKGSKYRMKKRGTARGTGNLGKLSKGALSKWKRYGKKATKKTDIRYVCSKCKKAHTQNKGIRARRVEFK